MVHGEESGEMEVQEGLVVLTIHCKRVTAMAMIVDVRYDAPNPGRILTPYLTKVLQESANPVFICVGTPKVTGDALGPLVGSLVLSEIPTIPLYGTLTKPVHATNIRLVLEEVKRLHPDATLIGIDSSMSSQGRVGYLCFDESKLRPGRAVCGGLPAFGHYKLYGNIFAPGSSGREETLHHLMSVSPERVRVMAEALSGAIVASWRNAFDDGLVTTGPARSRIS